MGGVKAHLKYLVRGDSQPIWSLAILTCIRYQYFLQYTIPVVV